MIEGNARGALRVGGVVMNLRQKADGKGGQEGDKDATELDNGVGDDAQSQQASVLERMGEEGGSGRRFE